MDEDERCHQLGILEAGQLRANGRPGELMERINATVIEVSGQSLLSLKDMLVTLDHVYSAAQLGTRLRVLVENTISETVEWLTEKIKTKTDEEYEFSIVRPSLEDVFIRSTGEGRQ